MRADWRARLEAEFEAGQAYKPNKADWLDGRWAGLKADQGDRGRSAPRPDRRRIETLREIGERITTVPEGFNVHRTIQRFLDNRRKAIETGEGIDWATGEALAFGSLLHRGPSRCACPARNASAAPSRSATRC